MHPSTPPGFRTLYLHVKQKNIPLGRNAQGYIAGSNEALAIRSSLAAATYVFYSWTLFINSDELHGILVLGDFYSPPCLFVQELRKAGGRFFFPVSDKDTTRRDTDIR
jgi:hypothetical protein